MAANTWDKWLSSPNCEILEDGSAFTSGVRYQGGLPGLDPMLFNNVHSLQNMNCSADYFRAVTLCSPLAAIIGNLADAYAAGKCEVLNRNTEEYVKGSKKVWQELMDKPNPLQTRSQFRKQLFAFTRINGYCFALKQYPVGFEDIEGTIPSRLWLLPPYLVEVRQKLSRQKFPIPDVSDLREIYLIWDGKEYRLNEKDLILFTDNDEQIDPCTMLPISRLVSLKDPISNIIAGMNARNNLITRRGALGFISSDSQDASGSRLPMQDSTKKDILREFHNSYGITGNRSLVAIVSAAVKWQQTAMNTKDLQLFEEHKASTADLCDRLGYKFYLMGGKDGTFNNVGEAEKAVYQNTIIPGAEGIDEALNAGMDTIDANVIITTDYSHIQCLQQSEVQKADARKKMNDACLIEWNAGMITQNQWKKRLGDDIIKEEQFDLYKPQYDKWMIDKGVKIIQTPNTGNNGKGQSGSAAA